MKMESFLLRTCILVLILLKEVGWKIEKAMYHQLELEDESRDITTFVTHAGLFRYKRLIFVQT